MNSQKLSWLVGLSVGLLSSHALAWGTITCSTDSQYRNSYQNGVVYPLAFAPNMPAGNGAQNGVLFGADTWNGVYQTSSALSKHSDGYQYCETNENDGFGVIAWDGGTCYDGWEANTLAVTLSWTQNCWITKMAMYFNTAKTWNDADMKSVAIHELGHYQIAAHSWDVVSVMGYTWSNTEPLLYLTADDKGFKRGLYDNGAAPKAELFVLPYKSTDPIVPDSVSYEESPPKSCTTDCLHLAQGDEISLSLTWGNAGEAQTSGIVHMGMYLDDYLIGSWSTNNAIGWSQNYSEFVGVIPAGLPKGGYELRFVINDDGAVTNDLGISSPIHEYSAGFVTLPAPSDWSCPLAKYSDGAECDCNCGAIDPDCFHSNYPVNGCDDSNECLKPSCTTGACTYTNTTVSCDDGLYCTINDKCNQGECVGEPRDCSSKDDQCNVGQCSESKKACVGDPVPNGTDCDDDSLCTEGDACESGECVGTEKSCTTENSCETASCSESTGECVTEPIDNCAGASGSAGSAGVAGASGASANAGTAGFGSGYTAGPSTGGSDGGSDGNDLAPGDDSGACGCRLEGNHESQQKYMLFGLMALVGGLRRRLLIRKG